MAIMSGLVFYLLPGMLGRLYDMRNNTIGSDIFKKDDIENAYKIENYVVTSEFKVVSELTEAKDFLDVSGQLSLEVKSGRLKIDGTGDYLKETTTFHNKVDLLVRVHYETVTFTLPSTLKPISDWQDQAFRFGGTHYVRSIKYGGDLIATVRFITDNEKDKQVIKGEIEGALNSKSGSFGLGLKGSLEKIKENTRDSAQMEINYYATVPIEQIPRTIDAMTDLINKFPEQARKINNGYGVPLEMEVFSLTSLGKDIKAYYQVQTFQDQLAILDEQYSDILNTKRRLADWLKGIPPVLEQAEIKKISDFQTNLEATSRVFSDVIAKIDLSADGKREQFAKAFEAYRGNRTVILPDMLLKELQMLKKDVLDHTSAIETDFGGPIYSYWGSDECPQPSVKILSGMMSTSEAGSIAAAEFLCEPDEKQRFPEDGDEDDDDEDDDSHARILPVVFQSSKSQGTSTGKKVKCASCRIPGKTTVTVLPAMTSCPTKWTKQYQGVLASTNFNQARGELACLDATKTTEDATEPKSTVITEVSPKCGDFPCSGSVSDKTAIPCVVCSITKGTTSKADVLRM